MLYFFIIIPSFKPPPSSYPTIFYLEIAFSIFFFLDSWTMYLYLNTTGVFLYPLFYYFFVHTPVINHTIPFLSFLALHYVDDLILQQNFIFLYCPNRCCSESSAFLYQYIFSLSALYMYSLLLSHCSSVDSIYWLYI